MLLTGKVNCLRTVYREKKQQFEGKCTMNIEETPRSSAGDEQPQCTRRMPRIEKSCCISSSVKRCGQVREGKGKAENRRMQEMSTFPSDFEDIANRL